MTFPQFMRQNARWLVAGGLLTLMSSFGQTFFISVFSGVIRQEFSLSHRAWGGIYSMGTLMSAMVMIAAIMVFGSAAGPGLTGLLIDFGIIFEDQMIGIALYFVFASGMAWLGIRRARHLLPVTS